MTEHHDRFASRRVLGLLWNVLARLLNGIVDDIAWRVEQLNPEEGLAMRRALAVTCAIVLVFGMWSLPARLTSGRSQVMQCASMTPRADDTPEYRLQIVSCAGAFFSPRN